MPSYSTQTSVEARISAARLLTLIKDPDNPTIVDADALASGIAFAGGYIAGRLKNTYGQTEIDLWVLPDDVPPLIGKLSDDLCIYQYAVSKPNLFPDQAIILETVDAMLDKIADGLISLDGIDAPVTDVFVTERIKSDFDPERDVEDQSVNPYWVYPSDPRELPDYPE